MNKEKWIIKDLLDVTSKYLSEKGIDSPRLCAELLLAHQLDTSRVKLYLNFDQPVSDRDLGEYRSLIRRRLNREPLQYITGKQEFWSMEFNVCQDVLIPRPESEILVEQAVSFCKSARDGKSSGLEILDLCTGCGNIAIAIARELPDAIIWAGDISEQALQIARSNAEKLGVHERIRFLKGDLFQPIKDTCQKFDVIVSNPPYVSSEEYESLSPEVREYEPRCALDGYERGLFYIEQIINGAGFLRPGGLLLIEMDPRQISTAMDMLLKSGQYTEISAIKDYSHRDRVVRARKTE